MSGWTWKCNTKHKALNHVKSFKQDNSMVVVRSLQNYQSDLFGYSHYKRFIEEKWNRWWRIEERTATASCVMRVMSCASCSQEGTSSV
jgi:hypothetical protein